MTSVQHYRRATVRSWRQHPVHWFLTVVTCGLWSPVLVLAYLKGKPGPYEWR